MALSECSATVMNATEPRSAAPQQAKATATEHRPSVTQHTQTHGKTQGHTSGIDPNIEPLCDNTSNKAMTLPQLWPLGRPQLAAQEERLHRSELRQGFAWAIQKEQHSQGLPVLPPCSWCGHPTSGYCDFCSARIRRAVCFACGGTDVDIMAACRRCHERWL